MKNENQKEDKINLFWICLFAIILVFGMWLLNYCLLVDDKEPDRGTFGDMFGAVNAIFSGLAFAYHYYISSESRIETSTK